MKKIIIIALLAFGGIQLSLAAVNSVESSVQTYGKAVCATGAYQCK